MRHTFLAVIALIFLSGASPMPAAADDDPDLDMKVGQMIMVGFRGLSVTNEQPIARDIRQRRIGGVILFDYDVPSRTFRLEMKLLSAGRVPGKPPAVPEDLREVSAKLSGVLRFNSFEKLQYISCIDIGSPGQQERQNT